MPTQTSQQSSNAFFNDDMKEIVESYLIETKEILDNLDGDLLTLEKQPVDKELLNRIFRGVHTVKGTSGFLGFEQMTEFAHEFENLLNKLRHGEIEVSSSTMDVIFEAYDTMKMLLGRIEQGNPGRVDIASVVERMSQFVERQAKQETTPLSKGSEQTESLPKPSEVTPQIETTSQNEQPLTSGRRPERNSNNIDQTIRVDVARLDHLMNLVGELVLGRNRLSQISFLLNEEYEGDRFTKELNETASQIDFVTTELQVAVMKTRMVPIAKVFSKFPRLIRDLSKEFGKEIELLISGEETELDKSVIEEINDPLFHLLRNACDHGIEAPEERERIGKPRQGKIWLKAEHEGNHIVITIQDDGRGMDPAILKQKAVEKSLITEAEANEMTSRDALNLIFIPGFSTAQKVTNISGRGVGMDVVKANITRLNGIIDIQSEIGVGTTFTIKLPLTLAIIQGLLVRAQGETFAIPLTSVLEVVRVHREDIHAIHGCEVIRLRGSVLSLARMENIFHFSGESNNTQRLYVVVVALADQRLGIVVDELLGQKEIVIKSLGNYLGNIRGIAGSTILGDGKVIMIVDVGELMKLVNVTQKQHVL